MKRVQKLYFINSIIFYVLCNWIKPVFFPISLFCLFDSVIFVYADFAAPNKFWNSLLSSLNFISYEFRELGTCTEVKSPNAHNMTNFTQLIKEGTDGLPFPIIKCRKNVLSNSQLSHVPQQTATIFPKEFSTS